jgi:transposase InsO family protein
MIAAYKRQFPINLMCRLLCVSVSGYYDWHNREESPRAIKNAALAVKIKSIFDAEHARSGTIRIMKLLRAEGVVAGRHRIARIMRQHGWRAKAARKYKATTNSNHKLPVAPNLLKQDFHANKPNEKYVSDITYIWTEEGWLYLAVVMDLYSRMVVGWAIDKRMTATLVMDAMQMALWRRKMPKNVIVHSDRGSQYCSRAYQNLLAKHGLICSMSRRGDCYDNAAMESWNHSLKVEAIHGEKFQTRRQAKAQVFEYIDIYYNRKRLHSRLGYLSPTDFEDKLVA